MFGMGTGGTLRLLSPEILGCARTPLRFLTLALAQAPSLLLSFLPRSRLHSRSSFFASLSLPSATPAPDTLPCFFPSTSLLPASALLFAHLENRTGKFDLSVRLLSSLSQLRFFLDQALDLLVSSTFICYHTSSDDLSTSSSLRGLTCL